MTALPDTLTSTVECTYVLAGVAETKLALAEVFCMSKRQAKNKPATELVTLTEISRQLAAAKTLDEVMAIRDKAVAAQRYAQSARLGLQLQNDAAELRLRAERMAGDFLAELRLRGGDRRSKLHAVTLKSDLEDLGITRQQSARWQREAAIPEDLFTSFVQDTASQGKEISAAGLLRMARSSTKDGRRSKRRTNANRNGKGRSGRHLPAIVIYSGPGAAESQEVLDGLNEVAGHHQTLTTLLAPILSGKTLSSSADRRLVAHYLSEIGRLVATLQELMYHPADEGHSNPQQHSNFGSDHTVSRAIAIP